MALDNPLHRRQADAVAGVFGRAVQALESAKELGCIIHVEAGAVVANEISGFVIADHAKLDPSHVALRGEFPGVAEQILHHDAEQARIAVGHYPVGDHELDRTLRIRFAQLGSNG